MRPCGRTSDRRRSTPPSPSSRSGIDASGADRTTPEGPCASERSVPPCSCRSCSSSSRSRVPCSPSSSRSSPARLDRGLPAAAGRRLPDDRRARDRADASSSSWTPPSRRSSRAAARSSSPSGSSWSRWPPSRRSSRATACNAWSATVFGAVYVSLLGVHPPARSRGAAGRRPRRSAASARSAAGSSCWSSRSGRTTPAPTSSASSSGARSS